ncbi:hypothetical protein [Intrasporangium chromatireducens]|uniref:hypothetical protein n=1 Tax=Intrasporangium chromatireducens TaxID=1386088 RepID=UPI0012DFACA4|nr:hypothetical protein [Intrasporangium chromatireducens]
MSSVRVRRAETTFDDRVVEAALGRSPLDIHTVDYVPAPTIRVGERIHEPTSYFLWHHCRAHPDLKTAQRRAVELARWLRFLLDDRGLPLLPGRDDPVFAAREADFGAFYRRFHYGVLNDAGDLDREHVLSSASWRSTRTALKLFYEYLERRYQIPAPFELGTVPHHITGRPVRSIVGYRPRRAARGSSGLPLEPAYVELLLQAALRIDRDGAQQDYLGADRDHAILALAFASGLRRNNLANVTTYEVPPPAPRRDFTVMPVADFITKGDAGGDAFVFSHHLPAVWAYIEGRRAELADSHSYRPERPLHVVDADERRVLYDNPAEPENRTRSRAWAQCDAAFRRRLVNPDGSSPVLFLNEYNAYPVAYDSLSNVIEGAREFARTHIDPRFPASFRIHDTRHTYAVHLLLSVYHGVLAKSLAPGRRGEYQVDHLAAALELVKASLGHASESSTRLYLSTAHRFIDLPPEQFIGVL